MGDDVILERSLTSAQAGVEVKVEAELVKNPFLIDHYYKPFLTEWKLKPLPNGGVFMSVVFALSISSSTSFM